MAAAQCLPLKFRFHLLATDMSLKLAKSQHGCAIVLGSTGLIILGPSGSGKSRLSHQLIEQWRKRNNYARWVADDRVIVEQFGNSYLVKSPTSLQGLAEHRFQGIESVDWQPKAVADLVVQLSPGKELERLPKSAHHRLVPNGPTIPKMMVPQDHISQAIELIQARLAQESTILPSESN